MATNFAGSGVSAPGTSAYSTSTPAAPSAPPDLSGYQTLPTGPTDPKGNAVFNQFLPQINKWINSANTTNKSLADQLATANTNYTNAASYQQASANNQWGQIGIQQNNLATQQAAWARQYGNDAMGGNALSNFNDLLAKYGISGYDANGNPIIDPNGKGTEQALQQATAQTNYQFGRSMDAEQSAEALSGVSGLSKGQGQRRQDITNTRDWSLADIGRQEAGLNIDEKAAARNRNEEVKAAQDSKSFMDNEAKSLGISSAEVGNRLSQALAQLGLDQVMTTSDIISAMQQAQQGALTGMNDIILAVTQISGIGNVGTAIPKAPPRSTPPGSGSTYNPNVPTPKKNTPI